MGAIASFFLNFFTGSTLSFVSKILTSLTDEHTAIVQAQTGLAASEAAGVVNAEIARQQVQGNVLIAMMSHPIVLFAVVLFMLGPALYDFALHLKSIGCAFAADAQLCNKTWTILEVPHEIEAWDERIVMFIFGLGAAGSVVTMIANKIQTPK